MTPNENERHEIEESIERRVTELGIETDPAFVAGLFDTFIRDAKKRMERLSVSLAAKDAEKVYYEAHSLRGGSLSIGANALASFLQTIEDSASEGKLGGLDMLFENVKFEFGKVEHSLLVLKERTGKKK